MNPRSDAFFTTAPFISSTSTTDGLFVYQAYYDEAKGAFVLTVEAANSVVLTFSNFPNVQGVYSAQGAYSDWIQNGGQMQLTLSPGTYSFVIA
jgi:hypothetical protein